MATGRALRRRLEAMLDRWERDMERLDDMGFVLVDANDGDPASEAYRNLSTAVTQMSMLLGGSDEALAERSRMVLGGDDEVSG